MPEGARVDSVESLKAFKAALWKFQEAAQVALGDAESDVTRVLMWVQNEQDSHWQGQIRKAQEAVTRCKEAVRMKKVFKDASGRQQSAVDEEKALQIAIKRLAEAESKLVSVRRWSRQLQKEMEMYKGGVQRFATTIQSEIPVAAAHLERLLTKLDAYLTVQPADFGTGGEVGASDGARMNRGVGPAATRSSAARPAGVIPVIPETQRSAIAAMEFDRNEPDEGLSVVISVSEASPGQQLCLARSDTGWTLVALGSTSGDPGLAPAVLRCGELICDRPDLAELMSLPIGFSVIIDQAGIVEVLDPQRRAWWRRAGPGVPSR